MTPKEIADFMKRYGAKSLDVEDVSASLTFDGEEVAILPVISDAFNLLAILDEGSDLILFMIDEIEKLKDKLSTAEKDAERLYERLTILRSTMTTISHSADYGSIISPDGDRHDEVIKIAIDAIENDRP